MNATTLVFRSLMTQTTRTHSNEKITTGITMQVQRIKSIAFTDPSIPSG